MRPRGVLAAALLFSLGAALTGCEKWMQNMYDQPKYETFESAELWEDGTSARTMPRGTIAQEDDHPHAMPSVDRALLQHGQTQYNVYCAPCHSLVGDGDGMVPQRGFPHPPSFHSERLRSMPDQHFYDVISNGYGVMYAYAARIAPRDRWAVVAYIRALQLSQHAELARLPDEAKAKLEAFP